MRTTKVFNTRTGEQSGLLIYGDYSTTGVCVSMDVLEAEFNGDIEEAFHRVKEYQNSGLLPRNGSVSRPLSMRDMELYRRNADLGRRHWVYISRDGSDVRESTGYDFVKGYGYYNKYGFIIVDKKNKPVFVVTENGGS